MFGFCYYYITNAIWLNFSNPVFRRRSEGGEIILIIKQLAQNEIYIQEHFYCLFLFKTHFKKKNINNLKSVWLVDSSTNIAATK